MKFRHFILPVLMLLAACSDPYPYPPQFASTVEVPPTVLPQPPQRGTDAYNAEIDSIIAQQHMLTEKQKAVIVAENKIGPGMIVTPVLGSRYTKARYPALFALLDHAGSDAWRISDTAEDYWDSPRPWYADARVQLIVPAITRPGYPSGHTTTNTVWAYVLSDLFPAKREALFARAHEIGHDRILGGAHFPHDVEGGTAIAGKIYEVMKTKPEFQRELEAARVELAKDAPAKKAIAHTPKSTAKHYPTPCAPGIC